MTPGAVLSLTSAVSLPAWFKATLALTHHFLVPRESCSWHSPLVKISWSGELRGELRGGDEGRFGAMSGDSKVPFLLVIARQTGYSTRKHLVSRN